MGIDSCTCSRHFISTWHTLRRKEQVKGMSHRRNHILGPTLIGDFYSNISVRNLRAWSGIIPISLYKLQINYCEKSSTLVVTKWYSMMCSVHPGLTPLPVRWPPKSHPVHVSINFFLTWSADYCPRITPKAVCVHIPPTHQPQWCWLRKISMPCLQPVSNGTICIRSRFQLGNGI